MVEFSRRRRQRNYRSWRCTWPARRRARTEAARPDRPQDIGHGDETGQAEMNAAFLGLAGLAALNPKLLIIDLILATNRRPLPMFVWFLLGGMGLGITVGLVDVFVVHLDAIKTQNHASGGLDLALGVPLLIAGALLAANHLHLRRRRPHPPPKQKPPRSWKAGQCGSCMSPGTGWPSSSAPRSVPRVPPISLRCITWLPARRPPRSR